MLSGDLTCHVPMPGAVLILPSLRQQLLTTPGSLVPTTTHHCTQSLDGAYQEPQATWGMQSLNCKVKELMEVSKSMLSALTTSCVWKKAHQRVCRSMPLAKSIWILVFYAPK